MDDISLVYQDDFLVFSKTFAEHRRHLEIVLERFRDAGLTLNSTKYQFGKAQLSF